MNIFRSDAVGLLIQELICEAKDHREEIQVACENIGSEDGKLFFLFLCIYKNVI